MYRLKSAVLTALIVSLSGSWAFGGDGAVRHQREKVPGSYIVMLHRGVEPVVASRDFARRAFGKITATFDEMHSFAISLPNEAAAEAISRDPRVEFVEEDAIVHSYSVPLNSLGNQWALDRIDGTIDGTYRGRPAGPYIQDVTIFLLDGLIPTNHDQFRTSTGGTRVIFAEDLNPGCAANSEPGHVRDFATAFCGGSPIDHGSAVASIIAGNTVGVLPNAFITSIKVLDCVGHSYSTILMTAFNHVITMHAAGTPAVVNMSFGNDGGSPTIDAGVNMLIDDGIFVVGAAGNFGSGCNTSPARVRRPGFVSVGATTRQDDTADYSNPCTAVVDLYAPGGVGCGNTRFVNVWAAGLSDENEFVGTSFAAPHVTAVAAAVLSDSPTLTPDQLQSAVVTSFGMLYGGRKFVHRANDCHLNWQGFYICEE